MSSPKMLYCHCVYAKVIPEEVKQEVLKQLAQSGREFEAVADLCEMSATRDPRLAQLATQPELKIAACYPRAVRWLFSAAGASLSDEVTVHNMRTETAAEVARRMLHDGTDDGGCAE